jgi:hypothetical protein
MGSATTASVPLRNSGRGASTTCRPATRASGEGGRIPTRTYDSQFGRTFSIGIFMSPARGRPRVRTW